MGKARVIPTKSVTIPRLKLAAATMCVRVGNMLAKELDDPLDNEVYWADSSTVLQYISNESKRFKSLSQIVSKLFEPALILLSGTT